MQTIYKYVVIEKNEDINSSKKLIFDDYHKAKKVAEQQKKIVIELTYTLDSWELCS